MKSPLPANAVDGDLHDVACPTTDRCFAVGLYSSPQHVRALVERMVGTTWTPGIIPAPPGVDQLRLNAVTCTGPKRCFAVGNAFKNSGGRQRPAISTWNGTTWSSKFAPDPNAAFAELSDVACPSPTTCLAVGNSTKGPFVARWKGAGWQLVPPPPPPPTASNEELSLGSITCPSTNDCIVVGTIVNRATDHPVAAAVERWNGTTWTLTRGAPAERTLGDVACTSATACFAVGAAKPYPHRRAYIQRMQQNVWAPVPSPAVPASEWVLGGVACPSAKRCIAVGYSRTAHGRTTLTERWNGTSWSRG
jgi:hypothetical protein